MDRRKFIINTGLGAISLYFAPTLISCSNKDAINLNNIVGQPYSFLSTTNYLSKEGNNQFGYYQFDEDNFVMEQYKAKQAFVFYKNSKIVGYTIQIEGIDFFSKNIELISKTLGKFKTNFKNDFGQEIQWNNSGKTIKLSVNNFQDTPKLSFYSEFTDNSGLII
ncbi:hypothetical protein [Flavobacterium sp. LHD-85]|uniref:hypothetical protein n=1 Tax=Flavobacterium sp. LHD-85 TaxID=3071410 RepID=UPI0027DF8D38|nr:hypothetical protein [Flavobacterium sp. LHD-85]MDQ6528509.1 hypothetical protein [Flavobacterium sp. LHD-85]